jgi:aspartate racemase
MQGGFYQAVFRSHDIEIISPVDADQDYIHARYMTELVRGEFRDETRREFVRIARELGVRAQLDGLILGGTELPLLLRGALDASSKCWTLRQST